MELILRIGYIYPIYVCGCIYLYNRVLLLFHNFPKKIILFNRINNSLINTTPMFMKSPIESGINFNSWY